MKLLYLLPHYCIDELNNNCVTMFVCLYGYTRQTNCFTEKDTNSQWTKHFRYIYHTTGFNLTYCSKTKYFMRQSANLSQIISPPKISPIPLSLSNVPTNTKYRNIDVIKFNQLINNKLSPASPAIIDTGRCPFCFTFDEKPTSSVSILQEHLLRFHGPRPNATKLPKVVVFI